MIRKRNWFGVRWENEPTWKNLEFWVNKTSGLDEAGEPEEGSYMVFGVVNSHKDGLRDLFWQVIIPIKIKESMDLFYEWGGTIKRIKLKEGRPCVFNMTRTHGVVQSRLPKDRKLKGEPIEKLLFGKDQNTVEVRALAIAFPKGLLPDQFKKYRVR